MKTKIHGHRGARGRRPENTLAALEYALQHGADGVEVDLQVSKDDVIVLHHDPCLRGDIAIRSLTYSELPHYGICPPTLGQMLHFMQHPTRRHVNLNLEMKKQKLMQPKMVVDLLIAEIETHAPQPSPLPPRIFVQSFAHELMMLLKQKRPRWKIGLTHYRPRKDALYRQCDLQKTKDAGVDVFSANYRAVDEQLIVRAHRMGLEVYVWTVNFKKQIRTMIRWGVDVITTDYPERGMRIKKSMQAEQTVKHKANR